MYLYDGMKCDYRGCKAITPKIDVVKVLKESGLTGFDLRMNAGAIISTRADESAEDAGWAFSWSRGAHYCPKHACTPSAKKAGAEKRTRSTSRSLALHPEPCEELSDTELFRRRLAKRQALTAARKGRDW